MSVSVAFHDLIRDTIKADATVMAEVTEVFDRVPDGAARWGNKQAYISMGPVDAVDDDAECIIGGSHSAQVNVWSRKPGSVHCKQIVDAVKSALHEKDADLGDYGLVQMRVTLRRVFQDPDGLTTHGVVTIEADIEEDVD